ncbi:sugar transferase [Microbacterium thalassium]|uniref:Exopolysaccharide biosynthesis polyprenyl glycosylphosphotransferase n=2 Tax=Microbacterium thalassium TaxID=362649 RepID=A0A7X0KUD3_9MICO|nr:sugar transferase [Microbacterium thalassium]MBB6391009.1 exopolysaccharide biosynthesis polyprenyl glycosylphosphotransferase [Microbacterium thalassium]GLK24820.1 polyprenyl glycosylphosphotransferase [Microbacterium thalassium]
MASNVIGAARTPSEPEPEDLNTSEVRRVAAAAPPPRRSDWRAKYARLLTLSDFVVLMAVVFGTQLFWFGIGGARVSIREDARLSVVSYWLFSAGLVVLWMWSLSLIDSRTDRVFGTGSTEYIRIISVSTRLFGIIAIVAFLLRVDVARGYLLISLPLGVAVLLLERRIWRQWLIARRRRGEFSARVLLVGSERSVAQIGQALQRVPSAGYHVVGACVPGGRTRAGDRVDGLDIPVLGDVSAIASVLRAASADTVAITSTDDLPPSSVKRISWELEAGRQHLVLAPSIVDVVGPRIQTRPVAGLPLIHVETPRYSKGQRVVKRSADLVLATIAVIVLSPVMLAIAAAIRVTSRGPALFLQTRVGLDGREFRMVKFRTMVHNAEELLTGLRARQDAGNEVLFKMHRDPRATRIGGFLRRYSLDELPQLFNVLTGSMSLVGPRPPLPREVRKYADHVHRRFMVKPGITGLWQVSGRSSLSWEESVRLDLSYVENWTLVGDLVILFRTARAALRPGGTAA